MNAATLSLPTASEVRRVGRRPNVRSDVARRYALASSVLVVAAVFLGRPGGWLVAWPALSLALVARAYFFGRRNPFHKRSGRVPVWIWLLLGPFLVAQRCSWWLQTRGRTPCSPLTDRVWIGRRPGRREREQLRARGVTAVLDLTAEFSAPRALRRSADYANLPTLDLTLPELDTIRAAVRMIDDTARDGRGGVYVHCALGYGRTAVVAAAYLLATGRASTVDNAVARVRASRPGCVFSPGALDLLEQFAGE